MSLAYGQRLCVAVQHFACWLVGHGVALERLLPDADAMNRELIAYVQQVYNRGGGGVAG